jgi:hypothetical protein
MSNPLINRWGSNLIWYNFWYSDTFYAAQVQQDRIFSKLLETYLAYGIESHRNRFSNLYWYKQSKVIIPATSYYRYVTIRRPVVKVVTTLRMRNGVKDFYRMRVWILRYDKWMLVNIYWFHPDKNKKRKITQAIRKKLAYDYISTDNIMHATTYRRFKTLKDLVDFKTLNSVLDTHYYSF